VIECKVCGKFSFSLICKTCLHTSLKPEIKQKENIISFYDYSQIEDLLLFKYKKFGNSIYRLLADNSFKLFSNYYKEKSFIIPIDDNIKKGFSHTAVLANSLKSKNLIPVYSSLKALSNIKYAGKDLDFRLNNPRNFKYSGEKNISAILVDDIVTTKTTLNEAIEVLNKNQVEVDFCLVLADKRL
jgi:competence protein ComFC